MANKLIPIQVVYAKETEQTVLALNVEEGTSVMQAILKSGLLTRYPEIDLEKQKVGVFSKFRELDDPVQAHDRIEIYRPLLVDPKEARRRKAKSR